MATTVGASVKARIPVHSRGNEVALEVTGDTPIGRTFTSGDEIVLALHDRAPACKWLVAIMNGYHAPGSPRHEYWCINPGTLRTTCDTRGINSTVIDAGTTNIVLSADEGDVVISTAGGSFPPDALNSEPPFEGFTLCHVAITLDDGVDQGGGPDARLELGGACPTP
jgi:hypothetical protein